MKKYIAFSAVATFAPFVAFAAPTAISILAMVQNILNIVIPILITLAVVYFIWGVIQYTVSSDEEAKKNARSKIIMGLIGLFVIVAFWGIINLIMNTFDVGNDAAPEVPCIPNYQLYPRTGGCL